MSGNAVLGSDSAWPDREHGACGNEAEQVVTPSTEQVRGAPTDAAEDLGGRRLSICLASPLFYPDYAGAAVRFGRYAPGLRARGIHMHVVAAAAGAWMRNRVYTGVNRVASEPPEPSARLPVHRVPIPLRAGRWQAQWVYDAAVLTQCRENSTPPDLLISLSLSPMSLRSIPFLWSLRRKGIPVIYVETMLREPPELGWKRWRRRLDGPLGYRLVDCVVVGSGVMRDDLRQRGITTRIEVIPHGVDLERFRPGSVPPGFAPARQRLGLDATSEMILFVGPLTERKGLDNLAAAWDRVAAQRPRAHLVLVGPERTRSAQGVTSFGERLRATLSRGRGADRVIFVGQADDVEEYLRAADLFVFPSRKEGMPNVVGEAFGCGVPCVLTPFLGLPDEFGRPDEQYVLVEHDANLLAASISELLADQERRRALGHAARRWAEEYLDVERSLNRLAVVCREVVEDSV